MIDVGDSAMIGEYIDNNNVSTLYHIEVSDESKVGLSFREQLQGV